MRKTGEYIASWWFTALLVLVLGGVYASFSFGKNPWPQWKTFVFRSPAGLAIYGGLIVNLSAVSARIIIHRLKRPALSADAVRRMDSHAELPVSGEDALAPLSSWLKGKGFQAVRSGTGIHAARGKYSFLPGAVFRLGLILILLSLPVSAHIRKQETKILHEGREATLFGRTIALASIHTDLPDDFLQVGEDAAFRLEGVSAAVRAQDGSSTITSRSPEKIGGIYYRIVHLGYAQPVVVTGSGKPFETTLDLDILPPGRTQVVSLPDGDRFLTFTLEPERTITKGIFKGKQFNLQEPFYRVVVQRGKEQGKTQGFAVRPKGQGASGGLSLLLGGRSYYVTVQAVRDPALFWIHLGVVLTLGGLASMLSRFLWFEKRFSAVTDGRTVLVGYSEEFYKKWGIHKFQGWKEELAGLKRP